MRHVSGDAIKVDGGWIVEILSCRLRVRVADLADLDQRVGRILGGLDGNGEPEQVTVEVTRFLHLDDCPPAQQRQLSQYRAARNDERHESAVPAEDASRTA
jgi:hypothetical protein